MIYLILIFLLGFYLRNSEYIYGMHTDGYMYAESARFLVKHGIFIKDCAVGNLESCRLYEQVAFPAFYPYLISLAYILFGMNSVYASVISALLSSFTIILIFLISNLLFKNEEIGLYSSLIFSLSPLDLLFANGGYVRPTAIFFMALTILFYLISLKYKDKKMWLLVVLTFSLTIYTHHQNLFLIVPLIVGFVLFNYFKMKKIGQILNIMKIFAIPVLIFIIIQVPLFYWLLFPSGKFGEGPISLECFPKTSTDIFQDMFPLEFKTQFMGPNKIFNPFISFLFLISGFLIFMKNTRKPIIFLWMIFLPFFFMTSIYSYCQGADYIRYIHVLVLPYSILSAASLFFLRKRLGVDKRIFIVLVLIFLIFMSGAHFSFHMFKDMRMEKPGFDRVYFEAVNGTPNGCTIITSNYMIPTSDVFKNNTRRSVNLWLIYPSSEEVVLEEISNNDCVIYFEDNFCVNNDEYPCKFVRDRLNLSYISSFEKDGNRINIHKVSLKS